MKILLSVKYSPLIFERISTWPPFAGPIWHSLPPEEKGPGGLISGALLTSSSVQVLSMENIFLELS